MRDYGPWYRGEGNVPLVSKEFTDNLEQPSHLFDVTSMPQLIAGQHSVWSDGVEV
jgi:hypothetical protein